MTDINHVVVVGRLTRDCGNDQREFGYLQNGNCRAHVSIAVNRAKKQPDGSWADEANYFDVTIWGKTAENLKPYLLKGTQIAVDGYLKQDRWEKDGQRFSRVSIVADQVQLCGRKADGQQGFNPQTAYPSVQAAQQADRAQNQYAPQFQQPQQFAAPPQQQGYAQQPQGYQQQPNITPQNFSEFEDIPF